MVTLHRALKTFPPWCISISFCRPCSFAILHRCCVCAALAAPCLWLVTIMFYCLDAQARFLASHTLLQALLQLLRSVMGFTCAFQNIQGIISTAVATEICFFCFLTIIAIFNTQLWSQLLHSIYYVLQKRSQHFQPKPFITSFSNYKR